MASMASSFFFYDLETSGFSPRGARIMQFAGQRTDMELKPIGDPVNELIKLSSDVLPEPDAILITGITPQKTLSEGLSETEFLKLFYKEVVQPNTIFVGFNSVRFDDEFMRFLNYRNFYDAYEWEWANGASRWDLLDLVRMTRALRPGGIKWPFASDGKPTNRLEVLAKINKLDHANAHDALSDVQATIDVARLLRTKQKDLFQYLLGVRGKKEAMNLVTAGQPFVYTTGRYSSKYNHTSVAVMLAEGSGTGAGSALVYDLRHDPTQFLDMRPEQLAEIWRYNKDPDALRLPVKTLKYNRCPAVAPIGVMKDSKSQELLGLTLDTVSKHLEIFKKGRAQFADNVARAVKIMDDERAKQQIALVDDQTTVDGRLYDGFIGDADKKTMSSIRSAKPEHLLDFAGKLSDERLKSLLPLYKARNFPASLTADERAAWDKFCQAQLLSGGPASRLAKYFERLKELADQKLTGEQQFLLEELQLYGQSLVPSEVYGNVTD